MAKKDNLYSFLSNNDEETTKSTSSSLQSQIDNYNTRLAASGVSSNARDTRNPLEKFLNLTPDQNFIYDAFEILGRPQQALFGAIDAGQKGENVLSGAWEGLSGQDFTYGGDLLRNAGMSDSKEGIGADDVLGFGLDVLLDPLNLVVPVSGAIGATTGKSAKAIKTLDTLTDTNKLLDATGNVLPTMAKTDLSDLIKKGQVFTRDEGVKTLQPLKMSDDMLKTYNTGQDSAQLFDIITKGGFDLSKKGLTKVDDLLSSFSPQYATTSKALKQSVGGTVNSVFNQAHNLGKATKSAIASIKGRFEIAKNVGSGVGAKFTNDLTTAGTRFLDNNPEYVSKFNSYDDALANIIKEFDQDANDLIEAVRLNDMNEIDLNTVADAFMSGDKERILPNVSQSLDNILKELEDFGVLEETRFVDGEELFPGDYKRVLADDGTELIEFTEEGARKFQKLRNSTKTVTKGTETQRNIMDAIMNNKKVQGSGKNLDYNPVSGVLRNREMIDTIKYLQDHTDSLAGFVIKEDKYGNLIIKDDALKQALSENFLFEREIKDIFNDTFTNTFKMSNEQIAAKTARLSEEAPELLQYLSGESQLYNQAKARISDQLGGGWEQGDNYSARNVNPLLSDFINKDNRLASGFDNSVTKGGISGSTITKRAKTGFMQSSRYNDIAKTTTIRNYLPSDFAERGLTEAQGLQETLGLSGAKGLEKSQELINLINNGVMETEMSKNFDQFLGNYVNATKESRLIDSVLVGSILPDVDEMSKALKAGDDYDWSNFDTQNKIFIPKQALGDEVQQLNGYRFVAGEDISKLRNKIKQAKNFNPDSAEQIQKIESMLGLGNAKKGFYMDNYVANLVNFISEPAKTHSIFKQISPLVDTVNNLFKKGKLLSPGYNIRNVLGGIGNMAMAGIPVTDAIKYSMKNFNDLKKVDEVTQFILQGGDINNIPEHLQSSWELMEKFSRAGFSTDIGVNTLDTANVNKSTQKVMDGTATALDKAKYYTIDRVNQLNIDLNTKMDNVFRLSVIDYYSKNPDEILKMGFANEGDAARHIMFDPTDLSRTESEYIKKFVPFYTFAKKNLAFQTKNILDNPKKYYDLDKAIVSLWGASGVEDPGDLQDYQRSGSMIPLPFLNQEGGDVNYLKTSLPSSDLIETFTNPVNKVVNMTSPLIKAPFEYTTGTSTFTGRPIEEYEGEMSSNIPMLSKWQEWGLGQLGFDTPLKSSLGVLNAVNPMSDQSFGDRVSGALNITGSTSLESMANAKLYQEIDELSAYVKKLQDAGTVVPTLSELENQNSQVSGYLAQLQSIK